MNVTFKKQNVARDLMGGPLSNPRFQHVIDPLLSCNWSPIILESFFNKYLGLERPFLRFNGRLPGGHLRFTLASGEFVSINEDQAMSLYRALTGVDPVQEGNIQVREGDYFDELDPHAWAYQVGYAGPQASLYPELTIEQNWRYFGRLYDLTGTELNSRIIQLMRRLRLGGYQHLRVGSLPDSVVRLADLGCALLHDPKLLLVHHPQELPDALVQFYHQILHEEQQRGRSIIISGTSAPRQLILQ